jgi:hypothetical protein
MRQIPLACRPRFEKYARPNRRERFLRTTESVTRRSELEALIETLYSPDTLPSTFPSVLADYHLGSIYFDHDPIAMT